MQQRFLLQILSLAQHVSGTTVPIVRSSRVLYSGCCLWYLVLWFSSCWSGVELRVMCPVCRMLQHPANWTHNPWCHSLISLNHQSVMTCITAGICSSPKYQGFQRPPMAKYLSLFPPHSIQAHHVGRRKECNSASQALCCKSDVTMNTHDSTFL